MVNGKVDTRHGVGRGGRSELFRPWLGFHLTCDHVPVRVD